MKSFKSFQGSVDKILITAEEFGEDNHNPDMVENCQVGAGLPCFFMVKLQMILRPHRGGTL